MTGMHRRDQFLRHDHRGFDVGHRIPRRSDQGQVKLAFPEQLDQAAGILLGQRDAHAGMQVVEACSSARTGRGHPLTMPPVTCPRTSPASSATASRTFATALRAARANGSTAVPTSVSRTDRPERSSSCWPSSDSSRRTWALTPGWATCTRVAQPGEAGFLSHNHETSKPLQIYQVTCVYTSLLLVTHRCTVPRMVTTRAASSLKMI